MAAEPSISEIVGRPDAELGTGQPAAPLDISSGLNAVTQAARDHSQNLLERYSLFQKTLGQFAQNHQLDFAGVMNEDIPKLKEKAQAYFAKVSQNPKMVTEIGQDPDWLDLQSSIQKSKQDNSYLSAQEEFRRAHPDLYNQTNDQITSQYRKSPLEARQAFNWDLPKTIDFDNLAKTALTSVGQNFDNSEPYSQPGYFIETKGKKYDQGQYDKVVGSIYNSDTPIDKYGHTPQQYAQDHFNLLPDDVKQQYEKMGKEQGTDGQEAWFKQQMAERYKPQDITDTQLTEDKYGAHQQDLAQKDKELAIQRGKLGVEQGNLGLQWWKAKNVDLPKAKAQMDLWKSNTIGGEEQKNAALGFTQGIMNQLEAIGTPKDKNGGYIITPNKVRQMTAEQLKYLGTSLPADANTGRAAGLNPLNISDKDAIEVLPNGQIKVLTDAHQLADGHWAGKYDQTKNTSVQNIATNRVNEELKTAGSKELNAYLTPDLMGTEGETPENTTVVSKTPTGTSQTAVTKSSEKTKTPITLPSSGGKVDKGKLQNGQVYNYNGKNYLWNGTNLVPQ